MLERKIIDVLALDAHVSRIFSRLESRGLQLSHTELDEAIDDLFTYLAHNRRAMYSEYRLFLPKALRNSTYELNWFIDYIVKLTTTHNQLNVTYGGKVYKIRRLRWIE